VVRDLAAEHSNVLLCDEHAFDSIERPEFYKDGLHLNQAGSYQFSILLAREVQRLLKAGGK
jgi:hypothetical protein